MSSSMGKSGADMYTENFFSSNKREVIFNESQYPYNVNIRIREQSDAFAMAIPREVFIENAEGWEDFRRGRKDHRPLAHIIALQFVAEALRNSKKLGTPASAGKQASFYYGGETSGAQPKFHIIVERLVRQVYMTPDQMAEKKARCILNEQDDDVLSERVVAMKRELLSDPDELLAFTEEPEFLWKRELMRDTNFVGIRFFFFAADPEYKFATALKRQLKVNRIIRSETIDDDDIDDDDIDAELTGSAGSADRQSNNAPRNISDEVVVEDSDDDAFGGAGDGQKKRKKRPPPKRYQKQKRKLYAKRDDIDSRRERLSPSDRPDAQFLHITSVEKLNQVLFKVQLRDETVGSDSALDNPNYDIGDSRSKVNLQCLLPKKIIPLAAAFGCDPVQCDPDNYYHGSSTSDDVAGGGDDDAVVADEMAGDDDDDDDASDVDKSANVVLGGGGFAAESADDELWVEDGDQNAIDYNERQRELSVPSLIKNYEQSGADQETISKNIRNVNRFANPRNMFFKCPCQRLVWDYPPHAFSAQEMMGTYFPWYIHSREYLEQKLLSTVLVCYRKGITNPQRVIELERTIIKEHCSDKYGHCESVERFMLSTKSIRPDGGSAEQRADAQDRNADPTTTLSRTFMDLEVAIQHIFSSHNARVQCRSVYGDNTTEALLEQAEAELYLQYCRHLERMRELATQHMYKVLNPDDDRLPDTVLAMLEYQRDKDIRCLCLDSNAITLDLSPSYNQLIEFLLQMETLEISSTHLYILDVMIAIFSAYLSKERTNIELKNNIMMHGAPGTGKSNIIMTAVKQLIEDSVDCVTARSLTAMVNPKSRNFTPEVFDESSAIFDAPDRALSAMEKKAKRIEQSGMTKQKIDYAYTDYDKLTGKRSVRKIKMPYEHVKIVATNVPRKRKKDAMDDRWKHITVEVRRRPGKDIINFKTALHSNESQINQANIKSRQERLQLLIFFTCISNKLCGLPRPNLDVMKVRLSQTIEFLSRHAPNAMFRVRSLDMLTSEILIDTIRSCDQLCFGSELSPFRSLADNEHYMRYSTERGRFREDDPRNYTFEMQDFRYEHLLALGPQLMCTDDLAIRSITGSVTNLLQPVYFSVIYYLALEYGSLDIRSIFSYFDDESEAGYQAAKARYADLDEQIRECGNRLPTTYKGAHRSIDDINKEAIDKSMDAANNAAGADKGAPVTVSGNDRQAASSLTTTTPLSAAKKQKRSTGGSLMHDATAEASVSSMDVSGHDGAFLYSDLAKKAQGVETYDNDDDDDEQGHKKGHVYAWRKPTSSHDGKGKRTARKHADAAPHADGGGGGEENAYTTIHVSGTSMDELNRNRRMRRLPAFNRVPMADEDLVTYCPSYLRLNCTKSELKNRGRDLCRKYGIDYETFESNVESLMHSTVRLRHVPNIPLGLEKDRDYINYRLASKLDPDYGDAIVESSDAMMVDKDCMYLAVDLLLEAPDRIVEKLVKEFEYEHTVEHNVLLGVADPKNPFCLKAVKMRPRPGKKIRIDNVNFRNPNVQKALYNGINTMMGAVHDPMADQRSIRVDGDLEEWALRNHFKTSGYDTRYLEHFMPVNEHLMMKAIYRDMLIDQSTAENAIVPMSQPEASRMLRMAYERYKYQRLLAKEKVVSKEHDGAEASLADGQKFRRMFGVLNGLRKQYRHPLLRYPEDLIIPGHDRRFTKEVDSRQKTMLPPTQKRARTESASSAGGEEPVPASQLAADVAVAAKKAPPSDNGDFPRVAAPTQDEVDDEMSTASSIEHSLFEPGTLRVPRSTGSFQSQFGPRTTAPSVKKSGRKK